MLAAIAAFGLMSTGCASIIHGGRDSVSIQTNPVGAAFKLFDAQGTMIHQGVTPSIVQLDRGRAYFARARYRVEFEMLGYVPCWRDIRPDIDPWYLGGNLIFGALIGYFIVDPLTGAMWNLPDMIFVTLARKKE
jgi:hypothetical protein